MKVLLQMLYENDTMPEFSGYDQHNILFQSSELTGKKNLVLFFYPKDFTAGCTAEVCSFRDNIEDFSNLNTEVIGVSGDSSEEHLRFAEHYKVNYRLLSDPQGIIRETFGVERVFGILENRITFIFNTKGILVKRYTSQLFPTSHIKAALTALQHHQ